MPRKRTKNQYWPIEVDDYIIAYNSTDSSQLKSKIWGQHLQYPFYKLAENIIHSFKFYYTDINDIEDLKHTIIGLIVLEKIDKFDPSKGAKSFSYFGTIIKRWLINYNNKNYKKLKRKGTFDEYLQDFENPDDIIHTDALEFSDFIDLYVKTVYDELDALFFKDTDKKIADAILNVFATRRDLEIFKKKALYIYIREQTECKTPHLTRVIKVLKERFYELYDIRHSMGMVYK